MTVQTLTKDGMMMTEFIEYLEMTLIPDLKEAGQAATAEDFEQCIDFMRDTQDDMLYWADVAKLYKRKYKEATR